MTPQRKTASKFVYRPPTLEATKAHAIGGGKYDGYIKRQFDVMKVAEGENVFRALPPTWEGSEHWALIIWVHFNIGADNQRYLCSNKMKGGPCCVCEEIVEMRKQGTPDKVLREMSAGIQYIAWAIDRTEKNASPRIWTVPSVLEKDINQRSISRKTGELIDIVHPDRGFDITFIRTGTGKNTTKYSAIDISRDPTPINENSELQEKILNYIQENPLTECLQYYPQERIMSQFAGAVPKKENESISTRNEVPSVDAGDADLPPKSFNKRTAAVPEEVPESDPEVPAETPQPKSKEKAAPVAEQDPDDLFN